MKPSKKHKPQGIRQISNQNKIITSLTNLSSHLHSPQIVNFEFDSKMKKQKIGKHNLKTKTKVTANETLARKFLFIPLSSNSVGNA